jgi:hypothetical protein
MLLTHRNLWLTPEAPKFRNFALSSSSRPDLVFIFDKIHKKKVEAAVGDVF